MRPGFTEADAVSKLAWLGSPDSIFTAPCGASRPRSESELHPRCLELGLVNRELSFGVNLRKHYLDCRVTFCVIFRQSSSQFSSVHPYELISS